MNETFVKAVTSGNLLCTPQQSEWWNFMEGISPLIAFLSLLFAIYVHFKTRSLISYFERPIITFQDSESSLTHSSAGKYSYRLKLGFENIGKHPATDLKITSCIINKKAETNVRSKTEFPNRLEPTKKNWKVIEYNANQKLSPENTRLILIHLEYTNFLNKKKTFNEKVYLEILGEGTMANAKVEDIEIMDSCFHKN